MQDLSGKATFTEEQISAMKSALDSYGIPMPQFKRIGKKIMKKFVKLCLHLSYIVLNTFHFDEIFNIKF